MENQEIEVKFYVRNLPAIQAQLVALGCAAGPAAHAGAKPAL